jgi:hypothetical protein
MQPERTLRVFFFLFLIVCDITEDFIVRFDSILDRSLSMWAMSHLLAPFIFLLGEYVYVVTLPPDAHSFVHQRPSPWSNFTFIPFGFAGGCQSTSHQANIDLRGTPFNVAADVKWFVGGTNPNLLASVLQTAPQVWSIRGGGNCGWNAPSASVFIGGAFTEARDILCSLFAWNLRLELFLTNVNNTMLPAAAPSCASPTNLSRDIALNCTLARVYRPASLPGVNCPSEPTPIPTPVPKPTPLPPTPSTTTTKSPTPFPVVTLPIATPTPTPAPTPAPTQTLPPTPDDGAISQAPTPASTTATANDNATTATSSNATAASEVSTIGDSGSATTTDAATTGGGNIVAGTPLTEETWFLAVVIGAPLLLLAIVGGAIAFCLVRRRRNNDRPTEQTEPNGGDSRTINVADEREMDSAVFDSSRQRMSIYANAAVLTGMLDAEAAKAANYGAAPSEATDSTAYGAPPSALSSEYTRPPAALSTSGAYGAPPMGK